MRLTQYGTPYVGLMRGWGQHQRSLALLVARAFLPQDNELFDTPINLDGNRYNCAVENLVWRPRHFAVKYNRQFKEPYDRPINLPLRNIDTGEVFSDSFEAARRYGLLERDLVLAVQNNTVVWPTYHTFEVLG